MSEYNPVHQTPHFSNGSPKHLQSSSMYSDALCIRLHILHNSTLPPASVPLHVLPLFVCLFVCLPLLLAHMLFVCFSVSPSGLFPLIVVQWTTANPTCPPTISSALSRTLRI